MMFRRWISMVMMAAALVACGGGGDDGGEEPQPEPTPTPTPTPDPTPDPTPGPSDAPSYFSTGFMKGSTMSFVSFLEEYGLQSLEQGTATDPYLSMKNHGANIVRLQLNFEAFPKYDNQSITWADYAAVVKDAKRAQANKLDVLLTLKPDADTYTESSTHHNIVPTAWKGLGDDALGEKLYEWVYTTLEKLAKESIYPRVVAVGNEVNIGFLKPSSSAASDGTRTGKLLKMGFQAVRRAGLPH